MAGRKERMVVLCFFIPRRNYTAPAVLTQRRRILHHEAMVHAAAMRLLLPFLALATDVFAAPPLILVYSRTAGYRHDSYVLPASSWSSLTLPAVSQQRTLISPFPNSPLTSSLLASKPSVK